MGPTLCSQNNDHKKEREKKDKKGKKLKIQSTVSCADFSIFEVIFKWKQF